MSHKTKELTFTNKKWTKGNGKTHAVQKFSKQMFLAYNRQKSDFVQEIKSLAQ